MRQYVVRFAVAFSHALTLFQLTSQCQPILLEASVSTAVGYLIGAVVAVLVALLLAPLIPAPGGSIVAVVAWIVAAILAILGVVALLRGRPV